MSASSTRTGAKAKPTTKPVKKATVAPSAKASKPRSGSGARSTTPSGPVRLFELDPNSGPLDVSQRITVHGQNIDPTRVKLKFGGHPAVFLQATTTTAGQKITCLVPPLTKSKTGGRVQVHVVSILDEKKVLNPNDHIHYRYSPKHFVDNQAMDPLRQVFTVIDGMSQEEKEIFAAAYHHQSLSQEAPVNEVAVRRIMTLTQNVSHELTILGKARDRRPVTSRLQSSPQLAADKVSASGDMFADIDRKLEEAKQSKEVTDVLCDFLPEVAEDFKKVKVPVRKVAPKRRIPVAPLIAEVIVEEKPKEEEPVKSPRVNFLSTLEFVSPRDSPASRSPRSTEPTFIPAATEEEPAIRDRLDSFSEVSVDEVDLKHRQEKSMSGSSHDGVEVSNPFEAVAEAEEDEDSEQEKQDEQEIPLEEDRAVLEDSTTDRQDLDAQEIQQEEPSDDAPEAALTKEEDEFVGTTQEEEPEHNAVDDHDQDAFDDADEEIGASSEHLLEPAAPLDEEAKKEQGVVSEPQQADFEEDFDATPFREEPLGELLQPEEPEASSPRVHFAEEDAQMEEDLDGSAPVFSNEPEDDAGTISDAEEQSDEVAGTLEEEATNVLFTEEPNESEEPLEEEPATPILDDASESDDLPDNLQAETDFETTGTASRDIFNVEDDLQENLEGEPIEEEEEQEQSTPETLTTDAVELVSIDPLDGELETDEAYHAHLEDTTDKYLEEETQQEEFETTQQIAPEENEPISFTAQEENETFLDVQERASEEDSYRIDRAEQIAQEEEQPEDQDDDLRVQETDVVDLAAEESVQSEPSEQDSELQANHDVNDLAPEAEIAEEDALNDETALGESVTHVEESQELLEDVPSVETDAQASLFTTNQDESEDPELESPVDEPLDDVPETPSEVQDDATVESELPDEKLPEESIEEPQEDTTQQAELRVETGDEETSPPKDLLLQDDEVQENEIEIENQNKEQESEQTLDATLDHEPSEGEVSQGEAKPIEDISEDFQVEQSRDSEDDQEKTEEEESPELQTEEETTAEAKQDEEQPEQPIDTEADFNSGGHELEHTEQTSSLPEVSSATLSDDSESSQEEIAETGPIVEEVAEHESPPVEDHSGDQEAQHEEEPAHEEEPERSHSLDEEPVPLDEVALKHDDQPVEAPAEAVFEENFDEPPRDGPLLGEIISEGESTQQDAVVQFDDQVEEIPAESDEDAKGDAPTETNNYQEPAPVTQTPQQSEWDHKTDDTGGILDAPIPITIHPSADNVIRSTMFALCRPDDAAFKFESHTPAAETQDEQETLTSSDYRFTRQEQKQQDFQSRILGGNDDIFGNAPPAVTTKHEYTPGKSSREVKQELLRKKQEEQAAERRRIAEETAREQKLREARMAAEEEEELRREREEKEREKEQEKEKERQKAEEAAQAVPTPSPLMETPKKTTVPAKTAASNDPFDDLFSSPSKQSTSKPVSDPFSFSSTPKSSPKPAANDLFDDIFASKSPAKSIPKKDFDPFAGFSSPSKASPKKPASSAFDDIFG